MNLTNRLNLPDALVRAIKNDSYHRPDIPNYFSCTELLKPARQRALSIKHKDEIVEDASDRIWSLLGQAVHSICERANVSDLVEKRFYITIVVDGVTYIVGSQVDNLGLENGTLSDFKVTSAYKTSELDPNWEAQLNIQAESLLQNGEIVNALQIIAILRDHSKTKAQKEMNYPQTQVAVMGVNMWGSERVMKFIEDRIRSHVNAERNLPLCTEAERWATEEKWALMKHGRKRAMALFNDCTAALAAKAEYGDEYFVERRPGESKRCGQYCPASQFCSQYAAEVNDKKEQLKKENA